MKKMIPSSLFFLGVLLFIAGCGTQFTPEQITATVPATSTKTAIPPTETAAPPTEIPVDIELVFDGESCVLSNPQELTPGEYAVRLTNLTDGIEGLYCNWLDDGHTAAELDAMQSEPGEYFDRPDWAIPATKIKRSRDADGNRITIFKFDQPGIYTFATGSSLPPALFGCGSINVVQE